MSSTLLDAIFAQDRKAVEQALARFPESANAIDVYGFRPLSEAAIVDDAAIANLLLEAGADPNGADVTGGTALHWAVDNHNLTLVGMLLEAGASPNVYNWASQPVLVYPLLREQVELKQLLCQFGADLNFAQDFIHAKLIGHRYALKGKVDLVNAEGVFVEFDLEGFFLESTLSLIQYSLSRYRQHFSGRRDRRFLDALQQLETAMGVSERLARLLHYRVKPKEHRTQIDAILKQPLLILPVANDGHATTWVRYKDFLAKCDRGEASEGGHTVAIYRVEDLEALHTDFLFDLIYVPQEATYLNETIFETLSLTLWTDFEIPQQVTGNCSWANVEAAIPVVLFFLWSDKTLYKKEAAISDLKEEVMTFFHAWQTWDKARALETFLSRFETASEARRLFMAEILGAVFFQAVTPDTEAGQACAQKIWPILAHPEYQYVLKNYQKVVNKPFATPDSERLQHLIEWCSSHLGGA